MIPWEALGLSKASAGPVWVWQHGLPADPAAIRPHTHRAPKVRAERSRTYNGRNMGVLGFLFVLPSLGSDTIKSTKQPL
jgi:hypothetical protein